MAETQLKKYRYILLEDFDNPKKIEQKWCRVVESTIYFYNHISIKNLIIDVDLPVPLEDKTVIIPCEVICDKIKIKYEFKDPELYVQKKK